MNVYIVRDAVEIGHFPRSDLEQMARRDELRPTDYYWHEGMENWAPLPELLAADAWESPLRPTSVEVETPTAVASTPPPSSNAVAEGKGWIARPIVVAGICVAALVAIVAIVALTRSKTTKTISAPMTNQTPTSTQHPSANDMVLKQQAFQQLKHKIDMLPITPAPPLNAAYYDFSMNMTASGSADFPWSATIHGGENVVDPETEATLRRTDFTLTVEYCDGEWTYKTYRAVETDAATSVTREIYDDQTAPVPPDIVGILGLKVGPR